METSFKKCKKEQIEVLDVYLDELEEKLVTLESATKEMVIDSLSSIKKIREYNESLQRE